MFVIGTEVVERYFKACAGHKDTQMNNCYDYDGCCGLIV